MTAKNVFSVTAILTLSCFSLLSLSFFGSAIMLVSIFINLAWVSCIWGWMYVPRSVSSNLSLTDLLQLIALKQQIANREETAGRGTGFVTWADATETSSR